MVRGLNLRPAHGSSSTRVFVSAPTPQPSDQRRPSDAQTTGGLGLISIPAHSDADNFGLDIRERADVTPGINRSDEQARNAFSLLRHRKDAEPIRLRAGAMISMPI